MKISIGKLRRAHGVRGEIKLSPWFPEEVIAIFEGSDVTLSPDGGSSSFERKLLAVRPGPKKTLIASFQGVNSPEETVDLTNCIIKVPRESMPDLPDGAYYYEEIVGLPVFDPEGKQLGVLDDFFAAGEKDVWAIKTPGGGEILVPCIDETLKEVDLAKGRIVIKPMEEME